MKVKLFTVFSIALIITFLLNQFITADDSYEGQPVISAFSSMNTPQSSIKTPSVGAGAALVMDTESGRVLYEKNARVPMAIASTTKIMTALLTLEEGNLEDEVVVSKRAATVGGSSISLMEGEKIKLKDLLYGLLLNSGNDAAIAIAEHIGGSVENFVSMMNKRAEELGAKNTSFKSPHGLDMEGHYSTAYDLALITRYALKNKEFSQVVGTSSASIAGRRSLYNTNEMLSIYPGADGVKTGYTGKAGRCLVTSATRNNWRIISVVLNCPTRTLRAQSSKNILDYAFSKFKLYSLAETDKSYANINIIKGIKKQISVVAAGNLKLPLSEDEAANLKKELILPESLKAPIAENTDVGSIEYSLNEKVIAKVRLKTAENIRKKGVFDYLQEVASSWMKVVRPE